MGKVNSGSAENIITSLQTVGVKVTERDRYDIEQWQNGRALQQLTAFFGWEIAVNTLNNMVEDTVEKLLDLAPGDTHVPCAHAAAAATKDMVRNFLRGIQEAINSECPEIVKRPLSNPMPAESL